MKQVKFSDTEKSFILQTFSKMLRTSNKTEEGYETSVDLYFTFDEAQKRIFEQIVFKCR